ncbi:hypothetical protein DBV15_05565 [Temnothorax longispinosus]|uniref:Uncharacterized protein n=1 Tax=Temnothorax longispinosus TaxID=300112 RepID=A0A4S2KQ23_9HYME|nr:hypothetical protein DBV15_05565 [Temnothorax longispinosus]
MGFDDFHHASRRRKCPELPRRETQTQVCNHRSIKSQKKPEETSAENVANRKRATGRSRETMKGFAGWRNITTRTRRKGAPDESSLAWLPPLEAGKWRFTDVLRNYVPFSQITVRRSDNVALPGLCARDARLTYLRTDKRSKGMERPDAGGEGQKHLPKKYPRQDRQRAKRALNYRAITITAL